MQIVCVCVASTIITNTNVCCALIMLLLLNAGHVSLRVNVELVMHVPKTNMIWYAYLMCVICYYFEVSHILLGLIAVY